MDRDEHMGAKDNESGPFDIKKMSIALLAYATANIAAYLAFKYLGLMHFSLIYFQIYINILLSLLLLDLNYDSNTSKAKSSLIMAFGIPVSIVMYSIVFLNVGETMGEVYGAALLAITGAIFLSIAITALAYPHKIERRLGHAAKKYSHFIYFFDASTLYFVLLLFFLDNELKSLFRNEPQYIFITNFILYVAFILIKELIFVESKHYRSIDSDRKKMLNNIKVLYEKLEQSNASVNNAPSNSASELFHFELDAQRASNEIRVLEYNLREYEKEFPELFFSYFNIESMMFGLVISFVIGIYYHPYWFVMGIREQI